MNTEKTASAAPYSYFQDEFVGFYDSMVSQCYGGTAAADVQRYTALLDELIAGSSTTGSDLTVVDLGCGSGRAILAMLEHLGSPTGPQLTTKLHLYGVDNSQPMLHAAEAKCTAFLRHNPALDTGNITIAWLLGSFEEWALPSQQQQQQQAPASATAAAADFVLVAGAGLHHVTNTQDLVKSLTTMARNLSPQGICVISYLPWEELYRESTAVPTGQTAEEFTIQGYRRVLLNRCIANAPDGSSVLHERFALTKLVEGGDGDGVGSGALKEVWCIEEGWQLRRLDRDELLQLAAAAHLVPSAQHAELDDSAQEHGSHHIVLRKETRLQ